MTLYEAFMSLGKLLDIEPDVLMDYAREDAVGGYPARWPTGSLWEVEGQVLYALVRFLRPRHVLEIGTHYAASSSHILTALAANKYGTLTSLDLYPVQGDGPAPALRQRWTFVQAEAAQWIRDNQPQAELVFEDALHDPTGTLDILTAVRDVVKPRVVVSHDAEHYLVGADVRQAFWQAFGTGNTALIEPSDCGLAWWVRE